jgi:hypothetical protein
MVAASIKGGVVKIGTKLRPFKVTKICKYSTKTGKRYRLAGIVTSGKSQGQAISVFTSETFANHVHSKTKIPISNCVAKKGKRKLTIKRSEKGLTTAQKAANKGLRWAMAHPEEARALVKKRKSPKKKSTKKTKKSTKKRSTKK